MYGDDTCVDLGIARNYYERSLELNEGNFGCVMGYLRLLREENDHWTMIRRINRAIKWVDGEEMKAKLKNLKAYIIWIFNPQGLEYPK